MGAMRAICLLLGLGLVGAPLQDAAAQKRGKPAPAAPAPAPAPARPAEASEQEKIDQAKKRYDQGITHYNLGEFDAAIEQFKAAYALTSEPGLLFNIAQAYRLKEDYKQALYFYKTYLRIVPDAGNRADVERWIGELERLQQEQTKIKNSKPQDAIPAQGSPPGDGRQPVEPPPPDDAKQVKDTPDDTSLPPIDSPAPPAAPARGRGWKIAGLGTAGGGVLLLGLGAWMGATAADDWDAINRYTEAWNADYQARWDEAERYDTLSTVAYIGGAAAVVAGGVFYYLGMREASEARAEVGVALAPRGASVTFAWGF